MKRFATYLCVLVFCLVVAGKADAQSALPVDHGSNDKREDLRLQAFGGLAIDTFAPAKIGLYAPDETSNTRVRPMGGVDFSYRLTSKQKRSQFWIDGGALYGWLSGDFCKGKVNCFDEAAKPEDLTRIVIQASSVELFVAPRLEFWTLHDDPKSTALTFYVTGRLGTALIYNAKDQDRPVQYSAHHVGLGAQIINGTYEGSQVEAGIGGTSSFEDASDEIMWDRLKIDARIIANISDKYQVFFRIRFDTPLKERDKKASSFQTFVGVTCDFSAVFSGKCKK